MKNMPYRILFGALSLTICAVVIIFCGFGSGFGVKLNEKSGATGHSVSDLKAGGNSEIVKARKFDENYVLSDISAKALQGLYRKFIAENCPDCKLLCFADVTGDGVQELILINQNSDKTISGYVYSYANGMVFLVEEKDCEEGRNFGWYLKKNGDSFVLAEETFSKTVSVKEYTLDLNGQRNIIKETSFEYKPENLWKIRNTFSGILDDYMRIYSTITCSDGMSKKLDKGIIK